MRRSEARVMHVLVLDRVGLVVPHAELDHMDLHRQVLAVGEKGRECEEGARRGSALRQGRCRAEEATTRRRGLT